MDPSAIADVQIVASGAALAVPGFGRPMVLGAYSKPWIERARTYSSLAAVAADFPAGTAEYRIASAIFGQALVPEAIVIARGTRKPTQVFEVSLVSAVAGNEYEIVVDGMSAKFTAADAIVANVLAGLKAAIDALAIAGITATVTGGTKITITATVAGDATHTLKVTDLAKLVASETTADPAAGGISADLDEIALVAGDFYAVIPLFNSAAIATALATWTEANRRLAVIQSLDSKVATDAVGVATDIAKTLQAAGRARSAVLFHPDSREAYAAALLGRFLPEDPGTETWANKKLSGVTAPALTETQIANLKAKNAGFYGAVSNLSITLEGKTASGEWIDTIRGRDALQVEIQARVIARIADEAVKKIAYTDAGLSIVGSEVLAALREFEVGLLVPGSSVVNVPKAETIPAADKAARKATGITFAAKLAGAIHVVSIRGTVTY